MESARRKGRAQSPVTSVPTLRIRQVAGAALISAAPYRKSRPERKGSGPGAVEDVLGRAGDDLGVGRSEPAAVDQGDELRPEPGQLFEDPPVDVDIGPLAEQIEMVGVADIPAEDPVLHLSR